MYSSLTQLRVERKKKGDVKTLDPLGVDAGGAGLCKRMVCDRTLIATCEVCRLVFRRCVVKREISPLGILVFLLMTLPLMSAQDPQIQRSPALPPDILGPQLIAWSQLQKPQPVLQPLPLPDRPIRQPDLQPANSAPQQKQPADPVFVGAITQDGARYVLKVSSNSAYQLDDQDRAKQYEGKQVRIAGTLDSGGKSLHITSIQPVS